jgi:CRISPR-associated endonuclease/helicase Cas3
LPGRPIDEWEPLEVHLQEVADLAAKFADKFGAADWGRLAGLWHDLGKFSAEFQAMLHSANGFDAHLETKPKRVDHSTAGAAHAAKVYSQCGFPLGDLLSYCIAGHHAGLADRIAAHGQSGLDCRLKRTIPDWSAVPGRLIEPAELPVPRLTFEKNEAAFQLSLFTRMLFSSLVDADFLATERFISPERAAQRPAVRPTIAHLRRRLDDYIAELVTARPASAMNDRRREILQACRAAAGHPPGLFSLTVPTGGGKTLSSLAFALAHAEEHDLQRVISAIPFTSIIEQAADEYRKAFSALGDEVVLEHHSNVDPDSGRETPQSRLAAENWDAPLIVTTNVQLFESLFAAQTSRCRKLHRIVKSVIILDEAQTLPVGLLQPCLAVLRELARNYSCSIVLCTATQPALERREKFPIGLEGVREIIPEPERLYVRMKRVDVQYIGRQSDEQLSAKMAGQPQMLCVVNTRPHAARLYELLVQQANDADGTFHLSTFMCGAHRSNVLSMIRHRLSSEKPCRVISTQLIEAGVDVDFPIVYRALTGIDSIAQAAGRCNREGRRERGDVFVFEPTDMKLHGYLASTAQSAGELLPETADLLDPAIVRRYFELHYWKQEGESRWDDRHIMGCFPTPVQRLFFQFRTASDAFRFIEEVGKPVFVPYGEKGSRLIEQLRAIRPDDCAGGKLQRLLRRLQRYTVNIYEPIYRSMIDRDIERLEIGYDVLINDSCYDDRFGFRAESAGYHEPSGLIA